MGALRSALLLRTGLRARPAEAGRVRAPHCLVNGGGITLGTQRRRQQYSTVWGQAVESCPTPARGKVKALSRMGKHIDGRHLGCSRTRLSSRSGAGSGPGAGGRSRKRPPSQAGSRARRGDQTSLVSSCLDRWGVRRSRQLESGRLVGLAQAGPPGELVMGTRKHVCTLRGRPLQPAFAASFTTAGVRADRVGAKLPLRAIATEGAGKSESRSAPDP
jgi:hypothetical protein